MNYRVSFISNIFFPNPMGSNICINLDRNIISAQILRICYLSLIWNIFSCVVIIFLSQSHPYWNKMISSVIHQFNLNFIWNSLSAIKINFFSQSNILRNQITLFI